MKKKMRKFLLTLSAALLLVTMTVGVTVAYLTDDETVINTFTVGKVDIKLDEADVDDSDNDGITTDRDQKNSYTLLPGMPYDKDPMVTVLKGSEKSFIRAKVTISKAAELDTIFAAHADDASFALTAIFEGLDPQVWVPVDADAPVRDAANNTVTYELRYNGEQATNYVVNAATDEFELENVFTKVNVPGAITQAEMETITGMTITVVAEAIQAAGFDSVDDAWEAFVAPVE